MLYLFCKKGQREIYITPPPPPPPAEYMVFKRELEFIFLQLVSNVEQGDEHEQPQMWNCSQQQYRYHFLNFLKCAVKSSIISFSTDEGISIQHQVVFSQCHPFSNGYSITFFALKTPTCYHPRLVLINLCT